MSLTRRGRLVPKLAGDISEWEDEVKSDFSQNKTRAQGQAMLNQVLL